MQILQRADRFLGRFFPLFVLGSVVTGLLLPEVFAPLSGLCIPLFAFITFSNSLGGGFRDLARAFARPLPVLTVLAVLHAAMPLAALGLGTLLFPQAPLFTTGLVLEYAIPTAVVSLMWTGFAGGDVSLCLSILLLDTLLSPVVIPVTLRVLLGSVVRMDTWAMMRDLLVMVAIPALLAMGLQRLTGGRVPAVWKPRLLPFSKVCLLLVVTSNATGCAPFLHDLNATLALVILAAMALFVLGFLLGYGAARLLGMPVPALLTMSINAGSRNISAGSVLAAQYFPADVLFPVAFTPIFSQVVISLVVRVLLSTRTVRAWREAENRTAAAPDPAPTARG